MLLVVNKFVEFSTMDSQPNIILIMTDQQRADFFASEGFALDTMPFVESLGRQGARFSRAYTPNPTCAPARCALLSGRFPKATRVRENGGIGNIFRPRDLAETLRAQGYALYLSGKNHSYLSESDFDGAASYMHTGSLSSHKTEAESAFDHYLQELDHGVAHEPAPFPLECQLPYRIVRDAINFVDQRDSSKPFFLWLSFPEPHNPYQVPEPYFSLFPEDQIPPPGTTAEDGAAKGPKWRWEQRLIEEKRPGFQEQWRRYRANYCGMIRLIDDQIRRFVEELEVRGLHENTLLVFTSDHGDYAGDYGLQRKGVGLPECLVRVPLIFVGPGITRLGITGHSTSREEFVSLVDIMPTLCEMTGAEIPYGVQGRSLWPLLTGGTYVREEFRSIYAEVGFGGLPYDEDEHPPLHFPYEGPTFDELNSVTQSGNLKMVRMDQWKLTYDVAGHSELYDLESDPFELRNLWRAPEYQETRARLMEELLRWMIRTEDDLPTGTYRPKRVNNLSSE